jgi:hypothetical protein
VGIADFLAVQLKRNQLVRNSIFIASTGRIVSL